MRDDQQKPVGAAPQDSRPVVEEDQHELLIAQPMPAISELKAPVAARKEDSAQSNADGAVNSGIKLPIMLGLVIGAIIVGGIIAINRYSTYQENQEIKQREIAAEKARQERQDYVLRIAKYERLPNRKAFSIAEEANDPAFLFHDIIYGPFLNMFLSKEDLTDKERIFIEQYRKDHPEYKPGKE